MSEEATREGVAPPAPAGGGTTEAGGGNGGEVLAAGDRHDHAASGRAGGQGTGESGAGEHLMDRHGEGAGGYVAGEGGAGEHRTDDILDRLRHEGGRATTTRRLVIDAMLSSPSHHLTAADVVEAVRRTDPDFHPSTVYRTLDRLTELGVVDRIQIGSGPTVHHLPRRPHRHLVCESCGRIEEAPPDLLDGVAERVRRLHGFTLNPATTALHGLCATCASRR